MSIAALIKQMHQAGAPLETIIMAVEEIEKRDEIIRLRREKDAARKRRQRDSHGTVTGLSVDCPRNVTDGVGAYIERVGAQVVSDLDLVSKKEKQVSKTIGSRFALTQIPDDWIATCLEKRPDLDPQETFDAFRDWWIAQPGGKGRKVDWHATWRTWLRNQKTNEQKNGHSRSYNLTQTSKSERADAAMLAAFADLGIKPAGAS